MIQGMKVNKKHIIDRFGRHAKTYSSVATVQAYAASQLAVSLQTLSPASILEIGCGTGLLSQHLLRQFPNASCLLTDMAWPMLQECHSFLSSLSLANVNLACMDGERLSVDSSFDLIVSSMTLHWFSDFYTSCQNIIKQLTSGGRFVFTLLGDSSFSEWHAICKSENVPIATPIFPSVESLLNHFPAMDIRVERHQKTYPSVHAFLHTLRQLGATSTRPGYAPLSVGSLRKLLRQFNQEITISYEVVQGCYIND